MKFNIFFSIVFLPVLGLSQGFEKLSPESSGINFSNMIVETDMINGMTYEYLYNGGGVSVADFNQDGLEDIFFTSNQGNNKIYLNKGGLKFVDASKKFLGKVQPEGFNTGSTIVDINNDGYPDIYVSRGGPFVDDNKRRNLLYINEGGKTFSEQAAFYGIDDSSNTTQAVFFDADNDNDLDLYLLNHPLWFKQAQTIRDDQPDMQIKGEDTFYENVDGKFVLATKKFGLQETSRSFGLGVAVSDLNGDGFQDIYVTNDYYDPDRLYLNQGNGKFIDVIKTSTQHIALYAMGVDIADFNNDLLPDIFSVDMASEDHVRSKKNMAGMSTKNFWHYVNSGNHYQYMFNAVQLNMGDMKFAEIAQLSGVSKTDWSWAPLIADYDNDGYVDIFITNGYKRDVRDNDYLAYYEKNVRTASEKIPFEDIIKMAPAVKIPNYIFRNNGDFTFSNKVMEWGVSEAINANGAAYADLDNDGDLDLVVNAMDDPSYILENKIVENSNYLKVELSGQSLNDKCIGARVILMTKNWNQLREVQVTRGFQSSVSNILHFGLGDVSVIDKLFVKWSTGEYSVLENIASNQLLKINYGQSEKVSNPLENNNKKIFSEVKVKGLFYLQEEMNSSDFDKEILLPNKMSELGPFISKGEVNKDGLDDIFIGGSRGILSELFIQNEDGSFTKTKQPAFLKDRNYEDMESVFFDADNDGDQDLYVVSGSNECPPGHAALQDRLYLNDGKGEFTFAIDALPKFHESGQKVLTYDFNADGWMDIVAFGRQVPETYPMTPKSQILLNQTGKFVNATADYAPELENVGMVTDALFSDFDSDGDADLICVGEWMPVTIFENENGQFKNANEKFNLSKTVGWWSSIEEYESNGTKKYFIGNISSNNKFHPSDKKPLQVYMNDFDDNGTNDIVLAKYQGGICYPVRGRQCSSEQMPFIKEKFPTYDQFAIADLSQIYTEEKLAKSIHFDATVFENSVLEFANNEFKISALPTACQMGPINSILVDDFDHDGVRDILCLGNKFESEVETIRYDSNFGVLLKGQTDGSFVPLLSPLTGLYLGFDIKSALVTNIHGQEVIMTLPKRDYLRIFAY